MGILYLCATPIGNLEDMTFRAIKILSEVDLIAAEDTRRTRKLLTHFEIHTPMIRFDEVCKNSVGEKIIQKLLDGESIAVVSDAGLPAISDPGAELVKLAVEKNIKVCPVPGANAALSALICSGLDTNRFTFVGFLPKTNKNRRELLEKLSDRDETLIFYESPHRIKKILEEMLEHFGNRQVVLARELTKVHEEFLRGNLEEIIKNLCELRGEFVIIVEKCRDIKKNVEGDFLEFCRRLLSDNVDKKTAVKETAKKFNLSRREVYNAMIRSEE